MAVNPLSAAFNLTPQEAVDYFKVRGQLAQSFNWQDVYQDEHAQQFTVSRLANLDLLQSLYDGLLKSVQGDLTRRDWSRNAEQLLRDAGWWGKKEVLDPASGEVVTTTFDPPRLKLIFDVNTRVAHAAGQWQRIERNKQALPYVRYITRRDERVRASHRAWDNVTLPVDDPFWKTHFPPNGWRCRCRAMSITQAEYDAGLSPNGERLIKAAPDIQTVDWVNKRTGVVERVPVGIDPGFAYNPGMAGERQAKMADVSLDKLRAAPAVLRSTLLSSRVVGEVSEGFVQAVDAGLSSIPESIRADLFSNGYQVASGISVVGVAPYLAGIHPRGYPKGATWENVDGGHVEGRIIAVGETSISFFTGESVITDAVRAQQIIRHEVGHALDSIRSISSMPEFIDAYEKDAGALRLWREKFPPDSDAFFQLGYLLQPGVAGREEACAELLAEMYGGGTSEAINAAEALPATCATLKAIIGRMYGGA